MKIKSVFKRYEQKYLLTPYIADLIEEAAKLHMTKDEYGETDILSIYYDTPDNRLIRNSIDKPDYKEKLRLRSYGIPDNDTTVFLELKKKYNGIVYKRRLKIPYRQGLTALKDRVLPDTQVGREIEYFCRFYKELAPKVVISYRRKAYFEGEFRLTLDRNILFRTEDLDLSLGIFGREVTDKVVMELKSERAIPFWLLELLNKYKVYKTPFSKYGTAYQIIKGEKTNG